LPSESGACMDGWTRRVEPGGSGFDERLPAMAFSGGTATMKLSQSPWL